MGYDIFDSWQKIWTKDIVYRTYLQDIDQYLLSNNASNLDKANLERGDKYNWKFALQGFINYKNAFGDHRVNSSIVLEQIQAKHGSVI